MLAHGNQLSQLTDDQKLKCSTKSQITTKLEGFWVGCQYLYKYLFLFPIRTFNSETIEGRRIEVIAS